MMKYSIHTFVSVAIAGLLLTAAVGYADDGAITISRDVPPHVLYDTIPPGKATNVRTSPVPEVNGALGITDGQSRNIISKEVSANEFAAATATPAGTYVLQPFGQVGMNPVLGASGGGSLASQMGGLTSSFGGGSSTLSNNVNSATGNLGNLMSGALQGLGAR